MIPCARFEEEEGAVHVFDWMKRARGLIVTGDCAKLLLANAMRRGNVGDEPDFR